MYDMIVISDIHLGSAICQDKALLKFLKSIELNCKKLIINGDLFDHWNFDAIICSHTHVPLTSVHGLVEYYNTGSWTYNPCTYLSIKNGMVELHNVMV